MHVRIAVFVRHFSYHATEVLAIFHAQLRNQEKIESAVGEMHQCWGKRSSLYILFTKKSIKCGNFEGIYLPP
jgi:hypothetical protein